MHDFKFIGRNKTSVLKNHIVTGKMLTEIVLE